MLDAVRVVEGMPRSAGEEMRATLFLLAAQADTLGIVHAPVALCGRVLGISEQTARRRLRGLLIDGRIIKGRGRGWVSAHVVAERPVDAVQNCNVPAEAHSMCLGRYKNVPAEAHRQFSLVDIIKHEESTGVENQEGKTVPAVLEAVDKGKLDRRRAVFGRFGDRFRERYGKPYPASGRDAKEIDALPLAYDVDTLVAAIDRFFADPDDFIWKKAGVRIGVFIQRIAAYLGAETAARVAPLLTAVMITLARRHGCTNPGRRYEALVKMHEARGTWPTNWTAAWELSCLQHAAHGCVCQRRQTPEEQQRGRDLRAKEHAAMNRGGGGMARFGEVVALPTAGAPARRIG